MAISLDGIAESLIEAARQPFLVLDDEMRVVAANPSFCRTFHVSMENILGHPLSQVCQSGWDIPALKEALHRMPERGDSFDDIEVESVFPSIGLRTLRMSARAVAADVAAGRHTVLSIEDITERRRMETELKESEVRYRRLFEAAQDGILILDAASGLIEQANPYLAGILGVPPSSLVGREMWDVGFFSNSEASRRAFRILQDKGYIRFEDLPLATREGKLVDVEFVCNRYSVGNRDKIQCNIRDVSDRKRAEAALRAAEKEIRQSLKMEAIGTLAGGVAHEFNNLLTSINGYTALSLPYAGTEGPLREYLNEIQKAGDRAAVLTRQLLAYSQKQILEPKTVNVNALVSKVVRLLEGLAGRDIELVEDLDSDLGWVRADPVQIEQALLNLAVNARDSL
ncbi:MAG TPA: PAS domain S-box protein, partial [Fibrobacteria bacterium]|nr:PAS domain S-box protein [Fibrobacteria bacterium]